MPNDKHSFSAGEAARIAGLSYRTVDHWARTKFIVPSIASARGTGTERRYGFGDLVALRVARELRQAGVSTQALRRIVAYLRKNKGLRNPLAEARLVVVGSDVCVVNGCNELDSLLRKPGQATFAFMVELGRAVEEVKTAVQSLRAA